MQHRDNARDRMVDYKKSVNAIFIEMQDEVRRRSRKKGGTGRHRKASYEGAANEYLRRVSVQRI